MNFLKISQYADFPNLTYHQKLISIEPKPKNSDFWSPNKLICAYSTDIPSRVSPRVSANKIEGNAKNSIYLSIFLKKKKKMAYFCKINISCNYFLEHRSKLVGKTRTVVSVLNDAEQLRIFACKCAGDACKLFVRRHT